MTTHYEKAPAVVARRIVGELVLVPIKHNAGDLQCIYSANETGGFIWDLLISGQAVEDITSILAREFELAPEQARSDVIVFVTELEDIGAIVPKNGRL